MASARDRPFIRALTAWFATAADLHDFMVIEPCADRDAVDIKFWISGDALQGYAHAAGISISAVHAGECWDFLFDRDVVAELGPGGWFCTLCPVADRKQFASIECLWSDHLFAPVADWALIELATAKLLSFFRMRGITWAKLGSDTEDENMVEAIRLVR